MGMFKRIGGTWYTRINSTGAVVETSVKVMSKHEWDDSDLANDPTWRPIVQGEFVIAVKVLCN